MPKKFDAEKYTGTWYELVVPGGKDKKTPKIKTKIVLKGNGMAEL